jgi:hypothetical protein
MGSLAVVVIDELPKNQLQVALAEDEQPVQGFVAQRLDHALAMGVGSWTAVGVSAILAPSHLTTRSNSERPRRRRVLLPFSGQWAVILLWISGKWTTREKVDRNARTTRRLVGSHIHPRAGYSE